MNVSEDPSPPHRKTETLSDGSKTPNKNLFVCSSKVGESHVTCCTLLQLLPPQETQELSPFHVRIDAPFASTQENLELEGMASRVHSVLLNSCPIDREKVPIDKSLSFLLHFNVVVIRKDAFLFDAVVDAVMHSVKNVKIPTVIIDDGGEEPRVVQKPPYMPLFNLTERVYSTSIGTEKLAPVSHRERCRSRKNCSTGSVVVSECDGTKRITHLELTSAMSCEDFMQSLRSVIGE
mmetsp:Transcript_11778/g.17869  ORF Transcript_11778/g.17869 Transcript_11778/m.17869 type:complete len:235 (-) Transcript_11778:13-717(-)